jgi:uncharacterized RDD family membrane protein YckC
MLYDAFVVLGIWMVTLLIGVAITDAPVTGPLIQSLLFVEMFAFFAWSWIARGQTIGMLAWGLHVETTSGQQLQLRHALLRFIGAGLAIVSLGFGYLWALFNPERRAWPDLLSGTRVRYTPKAAADN